MVFDSSHKRDIMGYQSDVVASYLTSCLCNIYETLLDPTKQLRKCARAKIIQNDKKAQEDITKLQKRIFMDV